MNIARLLRPFGFLPMEPAAPPAPVKQAPLKLSDAILRGRSLVPETHRSFSGCAIGTAYRYKTGRSLRGPGPHMKVALEFRVPLTQVLIASGMHFDGASREMVATYLDHQGY